MGQPGHSLGVDPLGLLFALGAPALATVATGLVAVIWRGERSIVVIAAVLLPIVVVLGEVVVPWPASPQSFR